MKMESHHLNVNALVVATNAVMQLHYLSMPFIISAGQMLNVLGKGSKLLTL